VAGLEGQRQPRVLGGQGELPAKLVIDAQFEPRRGRVGLRVRAQAIPCFVTRAQLGDDLPDVAGFADLHAAGTEAAAGACEHRSADDDPAAEAVEVGIRQAIGVAPFQQNCPADLAVDERGPVDTDAQILVPTVQRFAALVPEQRLAEILDGGSGAAGRKSGGKQAEGRHAQKCESCPHCCAPLLEPLAQAFTTCCDCQRPIIPDKDASAIEAPSWHWLAHA